MATPHLNLSGFVKFVDTPASRRGHQVDLARTRSSYDYSPATDFWKPMRDAIYEDRKTNRDGSVVRRAVDAAISRKRPSYQSVADKWPSIANRWSTSEFRMPTASTVVIAGLEIRVKPLFREVRPDGSTEDVAVWMNLEEPREEAISGALRLLARADGALDSTETFVDARRGALWSREANEPTELDEWIESEAADFVRRWGEQGEA